MNARPPAHLADLLEGLDGDARTDREQLLRDLVARDIPEDEIRAAHRQGRLPILPLEAVLRDEGTRTLEDLASAHGVDADDLELTRRALGLPVVRGQPVYGAALDDHAQRLRAAVDAGVPVDALVAVNRVVGRAMAGVAAASREVVVALLGEPEGGEAERAARAAQAVEALAPQMHDVLVYAYMEHVREMVRAEAGAAMLDAGPQGDVRDVTIGFADLVGFTSLGDVSSPAEVGRIAEQLDEITAAALRPTVSVVKVIGDEVMLASPDPGALVDTLLELLATADTRAPDLPRLRAGAATGPALRRAGDWYGRTVNLASRLTDLAAPGTLMAEAALRGAAPSSARWGPGELHAVHGFSDPIETFTASAHA